MTREEQIEREALLDYDAYADNNYHAFKRGVAWADENPNLYNDEKYHTVRVSDLDKLYRKAEMYDTFLEKACGWLKDWDRKTMYELSMIMGSKFIEDFYKAMEE